MLLSAAFASLSLSFVFALGGVGSAAALIPVVHGLGMSLSMARPLGLLINTLSLSGASYVNIRSGKINVREWLPLIVASLCFAPVGAYTSTFIPENILLIVFSAFLCISGLTMLTGVRTGGNRDSMKLSSQLIWGALAGVVSGLLGVGSGGVLVPLLGLAHFSAKRIASVTALVVPVSSFSGFLAYLKMGDVDIFIAIVCGLLAVVGGYFGTVVMQRWLSQQLVRKLLAITMLLLSAKIVFTIL